MRHKNIMAKNELKYSLHNFELHAKSKCEMTEVTKK